ncbi:hypothetical protein M9Y10_032681 [Tritrichomonas musculus]|uniref:DUF3447 domain-containing protein n=1 Tax=Tritrichomonas musculus TaxID=1915356 RepID=A0ABR2GXJ7_9EUKA
MFRFAFNKIPKKKKDWKIVINEHVIACTKKNAEIISKLIMKENKSGANKECYNITIHEFEDSFICSESDYEYFKNIFCCSPIQITNTNVEVLKKFANIFEIEELIQLLELFESYYDTITNFKPLQTQKDISNELLNIEENNFESILTHLSEIEKNDQDNIITPDLLYNIFLNLCFIRPTKIELLIDFLKKYEESTKGNQFQSFKNKLLEEFSDLNENSIRYFYNRTIKEKLDLRHSLKTMQFVLYYLCSINEINESQFKPHQTFKYNHYFTFNFNKKPTDNFTEEEIEEYKKTGYCPKKIYHTIKKDDLDLFTEMMTESQLDFNKNIPILIHERNPDICYEDDDKISYLNLAAFYGSEQIFNYILMNLNLAQIEYVTLRMAFMSGNINVIRKCIDMIEMDDSILESCIVIAIKYNYSEILEWLFENYEVTNTRIYNEKTLIRLIENAIKFNNIEVLTYLLSYGIDHASLFTLSLVYSQFVLIKLALELPYKSPINSKYIKAVNLNPYSYKYKDVDPLFIAIYRDQIEIVKLLVNSKKYSQNIKCDNQSPLFFAFAQEKIDIFEFFLKDDRFNTSQTVDGTTLFEDSLSKNKTDSAEYLLKNSDIEKIGDFTPKCFEFLINNINNFFDNIYNNRKLFYSFNDVCKEMNYLSNFIEIFVKVTNDENIENNKKTIIKENKELFACLAAKFLKEEEFSQFIDRYSININTKYSEITPLFCSIFNDNDTLKVILTKYIDKIDINYCTSSNLTALHLICYRPEIYEKEGCKLFIKNKDLKINVQGKTYWYTPLHIALISNNIDIAMLLLNDPKIDVNIHEDTVKDGVYRFIEKTVFEIAIDKDMVDIATKLLERPDLIPFGIFSSSFVYLQFIQDRNSLYPARVIDFFMTKTDNENVEKNKKKIMKENEVPFTCLMARYASSSDFTEYLDNNKDIDINAATKNREATPLLSSILNEKYDNTEIILNRFKNVDVNFKTSDNLTALHLIARSKHIKTSTWQILLNKKNLNVNVQESKFLNTPLHVAVQYNNLELIKGLLNFPNVDVRITNNSRLTPLQILVNNMRCLMWNHREDVISILEGFAKLQKLQCINKIKFFFSSTDEERLKKNAFNLAEQLFDDIEDK